MPSASARVSRLAPLLKWAGGKERELAQILPRVPRFARYFDLAVLLQELPWDGCELLRGAGIAHSRQLRRLRQQPDAEHQRLERGVQQSELHAACEAQWWLLLRRRSGPEPLGLDQYLVVSRSLRSGASESIVPD